MIYVEMYGRLGNQLFRYATARSLQLNFYPNEKITINFNNLVNKSQSQDGTFRNELLNFNVCEFDIYNKNGKVIKNETSVIQKLLFIVSKMYVGKFSQNTMANVQNKQSNVAKLLNRNGIYWSYSGYQKPEVAETLNKFVSGSFESPKYFDNIKNILRKEFTPIHPVKIENEEFYNKICNSNSVCISIRRGDFVNDEKLAKLHKVTSKKYFEAAIKIMSEKIHEPNFFIFSDDVEWAKKNLNFFDNVVYSETGRDPVWEKLRLMYSCKHFIISNSTFSWWAQYLSTNEDKIVISPDRWFNSELESELLTDNFIRISS